MPDLRQDVAIAWLAELDPDRPGDAWPPAVRAIETGSDAPGLLQELGAALDRFASGEVEALAAAMRAPPLSSELRRVLAQTGSARTLRILHWFGDEGRLAEPHLLIGALTEGGMPEAAALRAAIAASARRMLLGRLFAEERLAALAAVTEIALQEPAR